MRRLTLLSLASLALAAPVAEPQKQLVVSDLPGLANIPEVLRPLMHAGHLTLNDTTETNYFFWRFQKPNTAFNRTIIWLNGGPGCSSMDGALMETGPLRVNELGMLNLNNGSWYEAADLIFVDQPGGTGFSTTKSYDRELSDIAEDFVVFLHNYYEVFPDDVGKELYLAGESYAGQYIPFIADAIFRANENGGANINLSGLLIGNGWVDPNVQSMSYIPYLLDAGILHNDDPFLPDLLKEQVKCQNEIGDDASKGKFSLLDCENILARILSYTRDKAMPKDEQCINMYDTRLRDSYPSCGMNWPPDLPNVQPWLQNDDVVKALNLDPSKVKKWRECDNDVSRFLKNKQSRPSIQFFPALLEKLRIMLFNGNKDVICNNYGVLDMVSRLDWGGSIGFGEIEEYDWRYNGLSTGSVKSAKNLTFVDVYDSSHMVPFDKPEDSRGLFDIFVGNYKLIDIQNETYVETPIYINNTFVWLSEGGSPTHPEDSEDNKKLGKGSTKSAIPFVLYLMFIVVVGAVIYYFRGDRTPNKNSILKDAHQNKKKPSKKTVSWADDQGETTAKDAAESGKFGEFFNNFAATKKGFKPVNRDDDYEDIELNSRDDGSFDLDRELGEV